MKVACIAFSRVPATETQGRIHTSAQPSPVLPEPTKSTSRSTKTLRVDTSAFSARAAQSSTPPYSRECASRTFQRTVVSQQDEKSQIKNRAKPCAFFVAPVRTGAGEAQPPSPPTPRSNQRPATAPKKFDLQFPRTSDRSPASA